MFAMICRLQRNEIDATQQIFCLEIKYRHKQIVDVPHVN